jgi:putative ABC transport system permease protein
MALQFVWQDVRYAIRSYAKNPSFTLAVLATLTLGIGASTAIFSMVNGILLRPLPLQDPDRLVYANEVNPQGVRISVSWPNFLDWRERARSFESLAASREEPQTLTGVEQARRLRGRRVTGNFFRVLGAGPALGRSFRDDDDKPNAAPVAIVTDEFWRLQLGGDPSAIGRILQLNSRAHTIVGILPRGFEYLRPYDVFVSMGAVTGSPMLNQRGNHNGYNALGRLKSGVTVETADRELRAIAAALEREHPDTNSGVGVRAERLADRFVADIRLTLLALFGAVGFLLLIACVNVANLLIARGASRQHELAVRAALGGDRPRLVAQLLVESTLVSLVGGALGVVLSLWLLRVLVAAAPDGTPRIEGVTLDTTTLAFALGASVICGLVFGAFPALQASGVNGQHALIRGRSAGFSAGSHRVRRGLMVAETALALILLTGAGLMVRTLRELTEVETGFRPDHLLTTQFVLNGEQWTNERQQAFRDELLTRVRALPGVVAAAFTFALPIDGSQWNSVFIAADKPVPPRPQLPSAAFTPVGDGYFETLGMRLLRGRTFITRDSATSPKVIVINESLARRIWPDENPIGKRLKQGWPEDDSSWREVVGVVADVKFNGLIEETPIQVYLPLSQESSRFLALVARTAGDPASLAQPLSAVVHDLNRDLPVFSVRTMDQILETSTARQRMSMLVFIVFAVVALTLASVGLYGVAAHGVTERTHEIGVRIALGADRRHVLGLIVGQGLTTALVGTIVGLAGALALSRSIQGLLFGVKATDPTTLAFVVVTLIAVAFVACYIPAWRATLVDPTTALRAE